MIILDNSDLLRGDAAAATVVDYTVYGISGTTRAQLADGQLANTESTLLTASAATVVGTIILVNTDSVTRAVNLYVQPNGGTSRRIIPEDTLLPAGYSLHLDGARLQIYDTSGTLLVTATNVVSQSSFAAKGDLIVGTGANTFGALTVGSNNKMLRADSVEATGAEWVTLQGTSNQVTVTHNATDVTLSTPQNIHTGASPTFANLSLGTGELTAGSINRASGTLSLEIGGTGIANVVSTGLGLGTTTFGTNAATVVSVAVGTAPTTSPGSTAQLWVADQDGVAAKARFHMRDEAGNSGPIAFLEPKVNLLTNTGFGVWSNSTLLEATGGAAPVLDGANAALVNNLLTNGGFDSATTGWVSANSATLSSEAGGKTGNTLQILENSGANPIAYQTVTTVIGKLYQFNAYINSNASEATYKIRIGTSGVTGSENFDSGNLEASNNWTSAVENVVFEATGTSTTVTFQQITTSGSGKTQWYDSTTLYEVTPGCVAANTVGPDGWKKTSTLDVHRQHLDSTFTTDGEFYSCKVTKGANGAEYLYQQFNTLGDYEIFLNQVMTHASWAYSVTATDNVKIAIYHNGAWSLLGSFSGADAWEWQELTQTINSSSTDVRFGWLFDGDSGDVAYVQMPIVVRGSSIGQGNYVRNQDKIINLEKTFNLTDWSVTAKSTSTDIAINLEAQSNGKLPKGIKTVYFGVTVRDSGSSGANVVLNLDANVSAARDFIANIGTAGLTLIDNDKLETQARVRCNVNGDIESEITASGSLTMDVWLKVLAIELR